MTIDEALYEYVMGKISIVCTRTNTVELSNGHKFSTHAWHQRRLAVQTFMNKFVGSTDEVNAIAQTKRNLEHKIAMLQDKHWSLMKQYKSTINVDAYKLPKSPSCRFVCGLVDDKFEMMFYLPGSSFANTHADLVRAHALLTNSKLADIAGGFYIHEISNHTKCNTIVLFGESSSYRPFINLYAKHIREYGKQHNVRFVIRDENKHDYDAANACLNTLDDYIV